MNTRAKNEGPDGIKIWNFVFSRVKDQEQAMHLTKEIIEMKLTGDEDVMERLASAIDIWKLAVNINGGAIEEPTKAFRV